MDVEPSHRGAELRDGTVERVDALIARLASRQDGVVARWQLLAAGVSREEISHRLRTGRLHLLHRGVYAVGHLALTERARCVAAVLACGDGAVLSHASAAAVWELLPYGPVEVTVPRARRARHPGITAHRTDDLPPSDVRRRGNLLVTAPGRTILDLAATAPAHDLERALNEALVRRLVHPDALLARALGRPGARAIHSLLADGPAPTRSQAERKLLELVRRAGVERPRTNVRIGAHEVDALWRHQRVVVEVDGYAFHAGRAAFERDRRRDAELQAAGYRVIRVTWRQLADRPETVVAQLAAVLASVAA